MEGFTYVDIFATKGIEYLLVIGALLLFIPFWRMVSRSGPAMQEAVEGIVPAVGGWFHLPEGKIYYHQGHSWAIPESGNVVKVGIDDFAQKLVGRIDAVKFPKVGSQVAQGEKAWSLLVGAKSIDMLSPVDGKIIAINESLIEFTGKHRQRSLWSVLAVEGSGAKDLDESQESVVGWACQKMDGRGEGKPACPDELQPGGSLPRRWCAG